MRAARLRHKIIVERPQASQGDAGDEVIVWVSVGNPWAAIEPVRGREGVSSSQILADSDTLIVLRWSPTADQITAKWRFRFVANGTETVYNIAAEPIHVNMGQREIQFVCKSGVNQG